MTANLVIAISPVLGADLTTSTVVVLVDPLPVVTIKRGRTNLAWQEKPVPMGHQWIIREEGVYVGQRVRPSQTRPLPQVLAWIEESPSEMHAELPLSAPEDPLPRR